MSSFKKEKKNHNTVTRVRNCRIIPWKRNLDDSTDSNPTDCANCERLNICCLVERNMNSKKTPAVRQLIKEPDEL